MALASGRQLVARGQRPAVWRRGRDAEAVGNLTGGVVCKGAAAWEQSEEG
jgi:hypothetical protein